MSRTVIHGGPVVTASDEIHAGVLVEGGRIAALAAHGTEAAAGWTAGSVRSRDRECAYGVGRVPCEVAA